MWTNYERMQDVRRRQLSLNGYTDPLLGLDSIPRLKKEFLEKTATFGRQPTSGWEKKYLWVYYSGMILN